MPKFLSDRSKEDFKAEPDEDLMTKTAERLAGLGGGEEDEDLEEDLTGDEDKPKDKDEDEPEGGDEDEDEPEDKDEDKDEDKPGDDEIDIPEAYLAAAKHQGYSEEEVVELYEKDPEFANKVFKKMHEATNFISQQASDFARQKRKQMEVADGEKADADKPKYKRADLEKIKQKYGDDAPELIEMIEAQENQLEQLFDVVQKSSVQKTTSKQATQEETTLLNQIQDFFEAEVEAGYETHYGTAKRGTQWGRVLTGEQLQNRFAVVEEADAIFAGFELRGKSISYEEALERAHLVVSDKVREQAIRSKIGKNIKKRSKGITVKSTKMKTKRTSDNEDEPPKDPKKRDSWLARRTKRRMKKVFGGGDLD